MDTRQFVKRKKAPARLASGPMRLKKRQTREAKKYNEWVENLRDREAHLAQRQSGDAA